MTKSIEVKVGASLWFFPQRGTFWGHGPVHAAHSAYVALMVSRDAVWNDDAGRWYRGGQAE